MNQSFEGFQWFDARKCASLIMAPQAFFIKKLKLLDSFDPKFPDTWPLKHPTDGARALKELHKLHEQNDERRRLKGIEANEKINADIKKDYDE